MHINIYTANHNKFYGIEDHISILVNAFEMRGNIVKISKELEPEAVNIIIDEFTNQFRNREITEFREKYPEAKIYLVLTEFFSSRLLVKSLNFFGGIFDAAILSALNVYARLYRKEYLRPTFRHWGIALLYSPTLVFFLLTYLVRYPGYAGIRRLVTRRIQPLAYLHLRYLGLEGMINIANGLILAHAMIAPGVIKLTPDVPIIGTIYPEIDQERVKRLLFSRKELFIEMTGSITPYRRRYMRSINFRISLLGIQSIFKPCKWISFSNCEKELVSRGAYSLHPPQTRRWRYCSPTRIYRALQIDNCMPVLTRYFGQHPIEDLCMVIKKEQDALDLMFRFYTSPEILISELDSKISYYSEIARKNNDSLIQSILFCC